MKYITVIFILVLFNLYLISSLQIDSSKSECENSNCRAINNNNISKKPDDEDDGLISTFFSSIFRFFSNGFNTIFGDEKSGGKRKNYKNFQLFRALPRTNDQLTELKGIEEDFEGVKYWKEPRRNQSTDFLVPPSMVSNIKSFLRERNIPFDVLSVDLQRMIDRQNPKMTKERRDELNNEIGHPLTWRRYHRYNDISKYLKYLTTKYPDMVSVIKIGSSSGGLPLRVAKVSIASARGDPPKPAIWIDGGTHAREWISPAVTTYILKQLVENSKVNRQVISAFDWYILPVVNPDGYEYTFSSDRMWRKTRSSTEEEGRGSRIARIFFGSCEGVDINRNWDYHWGEKGASDDPCDETYAGPRAFSEPETRAIADFITLHKDQIQVFLTMHSYGQMWLLPWGHTKEKLVDHDDLMNMGQEAVNALARVEGTKYNLGPATSLLYYSSGGSDDWAKGVAGIKYAYTVELRDTGSYGFLLPAKQIIPTGKETFAAVKTMARSLLAARKGVKKPLAAQNTTISAPTAAVVTEKPAKVTVVATNVTRTSKPPKNNVRPAGNKNTTRPANNKNNTTRPANNKVTTRPPNIKTTTVPVPVKDKPQPLATRTRASRPMLLFN